VTAALAARAGLDDKIQPPPRRHLQPGAELRNQYGVWAVGTPEERRILQRERLRRGKQSRATRLKADPSLAPHGELSTYTNWLCRCRACSDAFNAYKREYRATKAAMRGTQPWPECGR